MGTDRLRISNSVKITRKPSGGSGTTSLPGAFIFSASRRRPSFFSFWCSAYLNFDLSHLESFFLASGLDAAAEAAGPTFLVRSMVVVVEELEARAFALESKGGK